MLTPPHEFLKSLSCSVNFEINLGENWHQYNTEPFHLRVHLFWSPCVSSVTYFSRSGNYPLPNGFIPLFLLLWGSSLCIPFFGLLWLATFLKNLLPNHCTWFTDTHKVNVLTPWTQTRGHCQTHRAGIIGWKWMGIFFKLKFNDTSGTWIHSPF